MNNLTSSLGTVTATPARKAPAKPATARKAAPAKPAKAKPAPVAKKAAAKPATAPKKAAPAKKAPAKPAAAKKAPAAPRKPATPARRAEDALPRYTIDKDRPTQHGKTRPSLNTTGGKLWAAFEAHETAHKGVLPTLEQAKEMGVKLKVNPTSTVIAYYRWRKFWGIRGRQ